MSLQVFLKKKFFKFVVEMDTIFFMCPLHPIDF